MNLGGKGGQGRVRAEGELDKEGRGGKKDVSRGPQPGVRGFKEDSGEIDSSEEVRRVFKTKCKRVADPPCSAALCRAVIISASASMH